MPKVELIYDSDCPNVAAARANLFKAFPQAGLSLEWTEWERSARGAPAYARRYGSPTILVEERDVSGESTGSAGATCRVYLDSSEANKGVPSVEMIAHALSRTSLVGRSGKGAGVFGGLAIGPGAAAAFLAKAACPLCYPAIGGLLSSLGLGFLFDGAYFAAIAALFLAVVLFGLAYRAKARRGYGPLGLGLAASAVVIASKFVWDETALLYLGVAGLVAASAWNLIPKRVVTTGSCPSCVTDGVAHDGAKGE